jgi:SAM-dependent methyltransferase
MTNFYATIARFYDAEHHDKTEDLDFYTEMAEEAGDAPILIIGSGTGRIQFSLAEQGFTVHGIEQETAMLERAQNRLAANPQLRERMVFHQGDALRVRLDIRFGLTIIPYNTLMHFHTQDTQVALLSRIRSWMADDGLLAVDLPNAGEAFAAQDTGAVTLERMFLEPESGHLVMQHSVSYLDRVQQLMEVTWIYDEVTADGTVKRTLAPVVNRYYFEPEIRLLLNQTGFSVEEIYGDLDRIPFEDGCPRMVVVARTKDS